MSKSFVKRRDKSFYTKFFFKKFLKRSVKERKCKTNYASKPSPTVISCIVLNASWMCVYMKQLEREGRLPHGGGSGGGLTGPSVDAQSRYRGSYRNPQVTSLMRPNKRMIDWMVLF